MSRSEKGKLKVTGLGSCAAGRDGKENMPIRNGHPGSGRRHHPGSVAGKERELFH